VPISLMVGHLTESDLAEDGVHLNDLAAQLPNWLATFFDLRNSWDRRSRGPGARGTATITGLARRLYLWGRAGLEGEPWAAPGEAGR
jgi:hypothetical protein